LRFSTIDMGPGFSHEAHRPARLSSNAAPSAFYALVEDIRGLSARSSRWCAAAQVRERAPGRTVATLTLAAKGLRQSFTTENSEPAGTGRRHAPAGGAVQAFFRAQWRFTPLAAEAAKVEFTLEYEFSSRVVATLLESGVQPPGRRTRSRAFARPRSRHGTDG
jgi:ribosome-associated toxin RatA of RatAB toxin-antitoxin module